jgi:uncharacterized membrane protein (UPF0127 family)
MGICQSDQALTAARLGLALALLLPGSAWADAACAPGRVDIRWADGRENFVVEFADDNAERAKGLMFREAMPLSEGMLFVYDSPRRPSFWMKNTLIPLDMVFADATGTVTRVHPDAIPGDLSPIDGGDGVMFVLEINGGLADKLGIAPGAVLRHPSIPDATAAWPCGQ